MNCLTHCWWQILAATVAYWMIGAIWFNPKVFGTLWQKSHGMPEMTEEKKKEVGMMMPRLLLTSFVGALFICIALCYFMCASCASSCCTHCTGPDMCMPTMMHNIKIALLLSIGTAGGAIIMGYVYQMKPLSAYIVDIGYHVVSSIIAVAVLHLLLCHFGG
jgi:hypothetical protein